MDLNNSVFRSTPKQNDINVFPFSVRFDLFKPESKCNKNLSKLATIRFDSKSSIILKYQKRLDRLSKFLINTIIE